MPRLGSHAASSTSWKPASPTLNCESMTSERTSSTNVVTTATCFTARGSLRKTYSGSSPTAGTARSSVRMWSIVIA